jgi:hypothetical protein
MARASEAVKRQGRSGALSRRFILSCLRELVYGKSNIIVRETSADHSGEEQLGDHNSTTRN